MPISKDDKVTVDNVNVPGHTSRVNAAKYHAVKNAMLKALPNRTPGLTHKEMCAAIPEHLDESAFPDGVKVGWWSKTVQLDLEAKGIIARESSKPLRWHRLK